MSYHLLLRRQWQRIQITMTTFLRVPLPRSLHPNLNHMLRASKRKSSKTLQSQRVGCLCAHRDFDAGNFVVVLNDDYWFHTC